MMPLDLSVTLPYMPLLLKGVVATIILSTSGLLAGTVLGTVLALFQISRFIVLRGFASGWILIVRSIPLLLLLFLTYYIPPILLGIQTSPFVIAWIGLTLFSSAFAGETIRSGLLAVPRIQTEAGLSLGLSKMQVLRLIVFPQALRVLLPPYMGLYTVVIKDSSLVVVLGYIELTRATRIAVETTYQPFQFYTVALIFYFLLCYPLSKLSQHAERRIHLE